MRLFYFVMIAVSMIIASFSTAFGIWAFQQEDYPSAAFQFVLFAVNIGLIFYWTYKSFKK